MTDNEPRTAKATEAVIRRGQETKATALREVGWLVIPPEVLSSDLLDGIDYVAEVEGMSRAEAVRMLVARGLMGLARRGRAGSVKAG